jgi:hypothetical protein
VLLGVAAALKPQLGLPFLALELVCANWTTLIAGGVTGAVLLGMGGARLWLVDLDWITSWRANLAAFKEGGAGNPAPTNEWRYQIISLHYPLRALIPNAAVVKALAAAICAALAATYWTLRAGRNGALSRRWHGLSRRASRASPPATTACAPNHGLPAADARPPDLLDISIAAVLGLLLFYHRFYDAVVLIFPAALGISLFARGRGAAGLWILLPLAVFLVPGAAALHAADAAWHIVPAWLADSMLWEAIIMPHQPWTLLFLACVLTSLARREA